MIGISGANRFNDLIHEHLPKTYRAIGELGIETNTGDIDGEVKTTLPEDHPELTKLRKYNAKELEGFLKQKFLGEYYQRPPAYSATKHKGIPLYKWAREKGVEIIKDPVKRFIHDLEIVKFEYPFVEFRATVGTGTYIRTLFEDWAKHLGVVGYLKELEREKIGDVHLKDSILEENWPQRGTPFDCKAIRPQEILPFSEIYLDSEWSKKYFNGISFKMKDGFQTINGKLATDNKYWVFGGEKKLIGLASLGPEGFYKPAINCPQ
jgi:tRNA pseudouridine55 synthase